MPRIPFIILIIASLAFFSIAGAQLTSTSLPGVDMSPWSQPAEPFHVAGPVYYVGTRGLAVYLVRTSQGDILLGGAMPGTAPLIVKSIRELGFDPKDIRILLLNHAHFDHAGTLADMKKLTGAKLEVMQGDVELLTSGGKTDYLFAHDAKFHFPPVKPDIVLKDGDVVSLGDVKLTAHLAAGHTRGCTVWTTSAKDGDRSYKVVFADGTTVNPGTRLIKNPSYPGIADDYRQTFQLLESLHPDIFLSYHAEFFDLEGKRARSATEGVQAWVDPDGYRKKVAAMHQRFEQLVAQEK